MRSALTVSNAKQGAEAALGGVSKLDKSGFVAVVGQALIFGIFALFDKLFVDTNFKCPCINSAASEEDQGASCEQNKIYSILFIVLTTVLAAFLGTAALVGVTQRYITPKQPKQKVTNDSGDEQVTGETATPEQSTKAEACVIWPCTKMQCKLGVVQFFVVAAAWMSIICIDGDYIACASTCNPYGNVSCAEIRGLPYDELPFSKEFLTISRTISQPVGIGLAIAVALAILASLAIPTVMRCKNVEWKISELCAFKKEEVDADGAKSNEGEELLVRSETVQSVHTETSQFHGDEDAGTVQPDDSDSATSKL